MTLVEELRLEISRSISSLRLRYANTTDLREQDSIMKLIESLNRKLPVLNQSALLEAANMLADTTEDLEKAVGAAKKGPFDQYLVALQDHLERLDNLSAEMHGREKLSPAPDIGVSQDDGTQQAPAASGLILPAPLSVKDYERLKNEYQTYFDACTTRLEYMKNVDYYTRRIKMGGSVYKKLGDDLGGIPWFFIGIIHGMECGFDFHCHLHNGDSLKARTTHVPANRPATGSPPFTWQQSAADALTIEGLSGLTDWSIPHMLYLLERYNGFGYRIHRVPTPYLWSFSVLYEKGKYTQDGKFDPEAVSKQCGAALILKVLLKDSN